MAATLSNRRGGGAPQTSRSEDDGRGVKEIMRQVKALDVYPKTLSEFSERTPMGGAISIGAICLICVLTLSQLAAYFAVRTVDHLVVDVERERLIRINLNLTFPALPCAAIGLVTMDVAGEQQIDVAQNVRKVRLAATDGQPLADQEAAEGAGSREAAHAALAAVGLADLADGAERCGLCYTDPNLQAQFLRAVRQTTEAAHAAGQPIAPGSASLCCNSCDDVRETYGRIRIVPPPSAHGGGVGGLGGQMDWRVHPLCAHDAQLIDPGALGGTHEGCAVEGFLHVNKVAGNFHIAPGRAFASPQGHLVHEFKPFEMGAYNTTHVINSLSFGPHYPNQVNPLDGVRKEVADGSGLFQYYIKVVPTSYSRADDPEPILSCQYSVTEAERLVGAEARLPGQFVLPGVFFIYDISPIMVQYREESTSLWTFLTSLCAIVGGVFVIAGMLDSALHAMADKGGGGGPKLVI